MMRKDMEIRLKRGRDKIQSALQLHHGFSVMATGITADDCRIAAAAVSAGVRIIELNHPSISLSIGWSGVRTMREAENMRHRLPFSAVVEKIDALRRVIDEEVYLSVAVPGLFLEPVPILRTREDFQALASAGADGLHVHKPDYEDLRDIVEQAHKSGLLVDAYISNTHDKDFLGVPADSEEEIRICSSRMQEIGVDFIGLIMGQSFQGSAAGGFSVESLHWLEVLCSCSAVPVFAEGGITAANAVSIREAGAQVAVVGTYIDDTIKMEMSKAITVLLERGDAEA